ncbi:MAG: hypothetical protein COC19_00765 [SAR86 cluster bacterium]|uniref:Cytochrome c domain-containing protein n=1 Tax=SAR86 cluster bacterium TaxID=2030880 RepID=A0A2A4MTS6_9GAMM|nr:MAG: hypothetical protein COC19_00765 [SAR86 cluster bacterium]
MSLLLVPAISSAADRVGDFSLLDQEGNYHSMSWYDDNAVIALLVQANDSTATADALPAFDALKDKFGDNGVEFLMINPMGRSNRDAVAAKVADYAVDIPVLMDDARVISEALGIEHAGEVLLFNPKSFEVEYRGSVAEAEAAITQMLAGDDVTTAMVATNGSAISYPTKVVPSYTRDIAPVLAENCASCHREGGVAPFAMDSHTMVQGWSPMIREVLMTRRMPPGGIDGHIGEFINNRLIEDQDIRNIIAWADAGAPKDGDTDPLAELSWSQSKWAMGEPDLIIDIPATTVPATGNGVFTNVEVIIPVKVDRWLRGSQIVAGEMSVLHHTVNTLAFPGEPRRSFLSGGGNPDKASITAYVPGGTPAMSPDGTGGLVKVGSVLNLNMHYTPNGRETVDASQLGLWFYDEDDVPAERMAGNCACVFPNSWTTIEPNNPNFQQSANFIVPEDARIHSFQPHMHFRGKSMRFFADYPDGSREELINVANYNYNWQLSYTYAEPKFIPGGTKITALAAWDNSAQNRSNPNPDRAVDWGNESWDEMFFGAMQYKFVDQGGEN